MQKIETREQMREIIEKERKRLEERKNIMHEIVSNNKYIKWLEEFTKKYPKFYNNDFFYEESDKVTKVDLENIDYLGLLFEGINDYAKKNYIYRVNESDYIDYYDIKYNNIGYRIGVLTGQGTIVYCEREIVVDNAIDFNDIILNKKQKNTDYYNKRLLELSNIISYYYEQGIPLVAIEKTIDSTLWNIKDNLVNKERKHLTKK